MLVLLLTICGGCWTRSEQKTVFVESDIAKDAAPELAVVGDPADDPISEIPKSYPDDGAIRILAWNIESDGANPDVITDQLRELPRYDVYGFTEVRPLDFAIIKDWLGDDYACRYSKTGYDDRLAYAIRKDRFEILNQFELENFEEHDLNPGRYRSPYVTEVKDKKSGQTLTLMLNHLARGKEEARNQQAEGLRAWGASVKDTPVIAIGDYNFDYVFATDEGNEAMEIFLRDGVYKWLRPNPMIDSNWYDGDGDGFDDFPGSLLDFVFLLGRAKDWQASCRVLVRANDFPDDLTTSDHRPIELTITPAGK